MPGTTPVQSDIQAICRQVTGTTGTYNEDLSAYLTAVGVTAAATATLDEKIAGYAALYGSVNPTNSEGFQWLKDLVPAVALNFGVMDPGSIAANGVTFSRASMATQYNAAGLLTWAPFNGLPLSSNLGVATTIGAPAINRSSSTVAITRTQVSNSYLRDFGFKGSAENKPFTFSVSVRPGPNTRLVYIRVQGSYPARVDTCFDVVSGTVALQSVYSGFTASASVVSSGVGAFRCTVNVINGDTATSPLIGISPTDSTANEIDGNIPVGLSCTLWDAHFTLGAGPQAYFPNANPGTVQYGPRMDYNPTTLAIRGLLIEVASTNLLTNSSPAAWTPTDLTLTANAGTSPMGDATATKLAETATTNVHQCAGNVCAISASSPVVCSVYLKAAERGFAALQINDSLSTNSAWCGINLTTGAVTTAPTMLLGTFTNMSVTTQLLPNGWIYVAWTVTLALVANVSFFVGTSPDGTTRSFLGTAGSGLLTSGGQVEARAYPTSHIPTYGTAATRATDQCTVAPPLAWTQAAFITMSVAATYGWGQNGEFPVAASVENVGFTNRFQIFMQAGATTVLTGGLVVEGGGARLNTTIGAARNYGVEIRTALRGGVSQDRVTSAGVASAGGSAAALTNGMDLMGIGQTRALVGPRVVWIRQINLWSTALTNAVLNALGL